MTANNHSRALGLSRRSSAKAGLLRRSDAKTKSTPNKSFSTFEISVPSHTSSDLVPTASASSRRPLAVFVRSVHFVHAVHPYPKYAPLSHSVPRIGKNPLAISHNNSHDPSHVNVTQVFIASSSTSTVNTAVPRKLANRKFADSHIIRLAAGRFLSHFVPPVPKTLMAANSGKFVPRIPLLTSPAYSIILSASVDINGLIESGGGTGPVKPRQPTQGASLSDQVPNPAQVTEINEKTRTKFRNLFSTSMGRGSFIASHRKTPRRI
jgi:hypothetical protein